MLCVVQLNTSERVHFSHPGFTRVFLPLCSVNQLETATRIEQQACCPCDEPSTQCRRRGWLLLENGTAMSRDIVQQMRSEAIDMLVLWAASKEYSAVSRPTALSSAYPAAASPYKLFLFYCRRLRVY